VRKRTLQKNDSTNKILENLLQEESTIFVKSTSLWEYARLFLPSMVGTNLRFKRYERFPSFLEHMRCSDADNCRLISFLFWQYVQCLLQKGFFRAEKHEKNIQFRI
jgi:hypothetical protein